MSLDMSGLDSIMVKLAKIFFRQDDYKLTVCVSFWANPCGIDAYSAD